MQRFFSISIFYLLSWLFCFLSEGKAQVTYSRSFEIDENSLSNSANVVFKDHSGFLWVGTDNGLYRFNGLRMQAIYFPGNSLPEITALGETSDATVWVGCANGRIAFVKQAQAQWFLPEEGLPQVAIMAFLSDSYNRLWFATAGEGIYYRDGKHLYNINHLDGLTDDFVYTLAADTGGGIVAGTDRGISFIWANKEKKTVIPFTTLHGLPDNIVRSLTPSDVPGYWWVGMQDKGLCLLDFSKKQLVNNNIISLWNYGQVNDILDLGNEIWVATEDAGLVVYNKKEHYLKKQLLKDSLKNPTISDLQLDNEGNVWFLNGKKIVRTNGNRWLYFSNFASFKFNKINTLVNAKNGSMWIATGSKLYECHLTQKEEKVRTYPLKGLVENNIITCLYADIYGFLWIGTMGGGVIRLNPKTGEQRIITENPQLTNGHILSIAGDTSSIWVASLNGVTNLIIQGNVRDLSGSTINWENYGKLDGIGSDYVYHLFVDSKHRLWLGTDGAGVAIRENKQFRSLLQQGQLKAAVVYSISEDNEGNIWFNTLNEGVYKYSNNKCTQLLFHNGLTNMVVTSIMPVNKQEFLMVNKAGIDIYNTNNNTISHFGRELGMESQQIALNAICRDSEGYIWLALENGLVRYFPFHKQQTAPLVLIDKVEVNSLPVDTALAHQYAYDQNTIRFLLEGLYFTDPEKVKFQYQLSGYTNKWETTSDPAIFFPQLGSGNYVFRVRSSANGNFDSAIESSYSFEIAKPFWQRWWFWIFSLSILFLLLYVVVRQRVKKIQQEEQIKNEYSKLEYNILKSQVNPHFLFNSFNALLNVMEDNPAEAKVFLKQLSSFYRKMTAYRDKEFIVLKEELEMLNTYLFIQKQRYGNALQSTINVPDSVQVKAHILPLALQLLAENAIKHNAISMETPLQLTIKEEDGSLIVINNINPKIKKEIGEGMGLQNIVLRFGMFTTKPVAYENKDGFFTVEIPLFNGV